MKPRNEATTITSPTNRIHGRPRRRCTDPYQRPMMPNENSRTRKVPLRSPRQMGSWVRYLPSRHCEGNMSPLPDLPGITWRGATRNDVSGLAAHSLLVHEAERFSFLPGVSHFEWLLEQPGMVLADDFQVAEHEGTVVADTGAWLHSGDKGARCIVWGEASPGFEYLKPHLFAWARHRSLSCRARKASSLSLR